MANTLNYEICKKCKHHSSGYLPSTVLCNLYNIYIFDEYDKFTIEIKEEIKLLHSVVGNECPYILEHVLKEN
jgi:hypothetical protein